MLISFLEFSPFTFLLAGCSSQDRITLPCSAHLIHYMGLHHESPLDVLTMHDVLASMGEMLPCPRKAPTWNR